MVASTLVDLVKIYATNTGTGALTLGQAVPGYRGVEALLNGGVYSYSIQQGAEYETGKGTFLTTGKQLVRTPGKSSNGGTAINVQAGVEVAFVALAEDILARDVLQPLYGYGAPLPGQGVVGQTYTDLNKPVTLYGPKTDNGWGIGVSLQGADGTPNVFDDFADFKASDVLKLYATVTDPAHTGSFAFMAGNYSTLIDDVNYVKADSVSTTQGAWVRQAAAQIAFTRDNTTSGSADIVLLGVVPLVTEYARGGTDQQQVEAAIAANAGRAVQLPQKPGGGRWQLTAPITLPDFTTLSFQPGAGTFAAHDGRAFILGTGCAIDFMDHESDGAAYPNAVGIYMPNGKNKQRLRGFYRIWNTGSYCIEFGSLTAGSGFDATGMDIYRYNSSGVDNARKAIFIPDGFQDEAVPRTFRGINTNGGAGFSYGGSNGTYVNGGGYMGAQEFSPTVNSRNVEITGVRCGNQSELQIKGHGIVFAGCDIAPKLILAAGSDNINVEPNTLNYQRVFDRTGNSRNRASFFPQGETPVLRADRSNPLTLIGSDCTIARSVATYTYVVNIACNIKASAAPPAGSGSGFLYLDVPEGCPTTSSRWASGLFVRYQQPVLSGDTTTGSATLLNVTGDPLSVGQTVSGAGIPSGAFVQRAYGTTVVLSAAVTATATGVALTVGEQSMAAGAIVQTIAESYSGTTPQGVGDGRMLLVDSNGRSIAPANFAPGWALTGIFGRLQWDA